MSRHLRLGVVLRLREMEEEAARTRLAGALQTHRLALGSHDEAVGWLAERSVALAAVQLDGGWAERLIASARALALAGERCAVASLAVETAAEALVTRRQELAGAARRRQVVERLRDRIASEERLATHRSEQAAASERTTARHAWLAIMERDR